MSKAIPLQPKTVVITGASAGVGRAVARRFAAEGMRIGLIARNDRRLQAAAQEVGNAGGKALVLPLDIADADAVEAAAERVETEFGPIDVWINVAMATIFGPVDRISPEEFKRATEVTYLGFVYGTLAALRRMKRRDRGVIVQTGSSLAYRSIPLQAPYCAAKHAMVGFTDSLRSELIHDKSNVRLTVVNLPAVNTPQFDWARNKMPRRPQPLPPIFEPEVAAEQIHYAAFHPRREFWLAWSTWKAMLGQKVVPGRLDGFLARAAYSGQQTKENALDQPDNLFESVDGDYGAHGRFGDRARAGSSELRLSERPGLTAVLAAGTVAVIVLSSTLLFRRASHRR